MHKKSKGQSFLQGAFIMMAASLVVKVIGAFFQIPLQNLIGGEKSPVWKVDFKTYDLSTTMRNQNTWALILSTRYWTASVTAYFLRGREFVGLRLINPIGFTVTRYSQTEVEIF